MTVSNVVPPMPGDEALALPSLVRTAVYMDTTVAIEVVDPADDAAALAAIGHAFGWFEEVERRCSRFDPQSELSRLSLTCLEPVPVSPLLLNLLQLAIAIAAESGGAFDPTVGAAMEALGFDRNFRTGEHLRHAPETGGRPSYRDLSIDPAASTVTLARPLVLDLGAIAKGFAMDLAGRELVPFGRFAINAGGDILVHGKNARGTPWQIGIRHPRDAGALLGTLALEDGAVCTSGDYERPSEDGSHHILVPMSGSSVHDVVSVTVLAPTAALADALATAAFVMGAGAAIPLLERSGAAGLVVTSALEARSTNDFPPLQ